MKNDNNEPCLMCSTLASDMGAKVKSIFHLFIYLNNLLIH